MLGGGPISFIENRGQFDPDVKFQVRSGGKVLWFTQAGLVFDVVRPVANSKAAPLHPELMPELMPAMFPSRAGSQPRLPSGEVERLVFSEDFANGRVPPRIEASAAQAGVYNYFIGNDPKNWRTGVVGYSQLLYRDVWPGIDIRFAVKGRDIEQEFLVHPAADTSRIDVHYSGIKRLQVTCDGSLVVQTSFGPLRESAPLIYSENRGRRTLVHGNYKISGDLAYAFQLGSYRKAHSLVIDPTLLFSTYIGGPGVDLGKAIAVDSAGNTYVAGNTALGAGYPTSFGVLQPSCPNSANCFNSYSGVVTKLDALGRLGYSTYLGSPSGGDNARGIAVDKNGEAYVAGLAQPGFPTTSSAFQNGCSGSSFVAKLNSTGTALLYSTCLGADGPNSIANGVGGANGIAVDMGGRAYVTGGTASPFPTTASALQPILAGTLNAFVAVIDPSFSGVASLVYSTLLGGEIDDWGRAIAVDAYGIAYITGNTFSSHFPVTQNAFQPTDPQGTCVLGTLPFTTSQCSSAFVVKLNPNVAGRSGLIYSTYLGGNLGNTGAPSSVGDYGYAIAVDPSGNAYVGGSTNSLNFPTTNGAFQTFSNCSTGSPAGSGFVTKIDAGGSALGYSTFLTPTGGGPCATAVSGIALDSSGNAYVVGATRSTNFPVTPSAFQNTNHGGPVYGYDAFLTELSASGSSLIYSSYLGGSGEDSAAGVAVDVSGDVFLTGTTSSLNFPLTPFAFQAVYGGNGGDCNFLPCGDFFVTKFPLGAPGVLSITGIIPNFGGNAGTVSPQIAGSGFHGGATARLNCGSAVAGTNVSVGASGRIINGTFNLAAVSPGTCSVVVTNPDGTSVTLPQGFTIRQGGAPNIQSLWFG